MIKRGTINSVLIEIEKLSEDEYSLKSGVKLFINTAYVSQQRGDMQLDVNPHDQRIYGTCVAIPELLTKGDQVKYEEGDYRYVDSIEPEVKVGDKVYFTYIAVNKGSLIEYEGKSYCNVPYSAILCVVRDRPEGWLIDIVKAMDHCKKEGIDFDSFMEQVMNKSIKVDFQETLEAKKEIIPIGGNILCEEYYGKDATYTEVDGKKIYGEVSPSGLITTIIKKPSQKHAVVKIVGAPLKEDNMEVSVGDIIMFPNKFGFKNNIEGTDYLFVKYWDIHAIVGNETESLV